MRTRHEIARVECLFVALSPAPLELLGPLLHRIEEPLDGRTPRLEIPAEAARGVDDRTLQTAGLSRRGTVWIREAPPYPA